LILPFLVAKMQFDSAFLGVFIVKKNTSLGRLKNAILKLSISFPNFVSVGVVCDRNSEAAGG
jgi:hypothetical protein